MMLRGREMKGHLKDQVYFVAFIAAACYLQDSDRKVTTVASQVLI